MTTSLLPPLLWDSPGYFFGTNQTSTFVNNNGNLTFGSSLATYTPFDLGNTTVAIIAPFFGDVDTSQTGSNVVTYGTGTVDGRLAFGANWPGVSCITFNSSVGGPLNYFQVLLIDRSDIAVGDFDIEFNYDQVLWSSLDTSAADGECAAGSGIVAPRAGYANGSGTFFEIDGSGIPDAFLDSNAITGLVNNRLNSSQVGRYVFPVRDGIPSSEPVGVPTLSQWGLIGMAAALAVLFVAMARRQRRALKTRP